MIICEPTNKGDQVKVTFILPAGDGPVARSGRGRSGLVVCRWAAAQRDPWSE
jgi:hypothetical protein